jgi:hypothetical protein
MMPLIIYYSFSGNNELLAQHLAERLGCTVEAVVEKKKRRPLTILLDLAFRRRPAIEEIRAAPARHDHVLFLAPLWNMRVASPMASAIRQTRHELPAYSFVTLCGGERPGQRERVTGELEELAGKPPIHVWELHVEDLVPRGAKPAAVTGHRVAPDELGAYRDVIDEIVRALEPARATSSPPGPHAA